MSQALKMIGTETYPPKEIITSGLILLTKENALKIPEIVLGMPIKVFGRYRRSNLPQGIV